MRILNPYTFAALLASILTLTAADPSPLREQPEPIAPSIAGIGRRLPDFEFVTVTGKKGRWPAKNRRATLLAFTSTTCPVARRQLGNLQELERLNPAVQFIYIDPVASDPARELQAFAGKNRTVIHDRSQKLASALEARSTTEIVLADPTGTVVYRGAVDDQYGIGYSLDAPRHRYLQEALEALGRHETPRVPATTAPGCALSLEKTQPLRVTYYNQVSRILQSHCVECHRGDGIAPFSLESYEAIAGHAAMMRKVVSGGSMPPWFAAPGEARDLHWINQRTLPAREREELLAWLAGDQPRGNREEAPEPRRFPREWQIGTPDLVLQLPSPVPVPPEGRMPYVNLQVPTGLVENRWVEAMEIQPTARAVVHHVLVFVIPRGSEGNRRNRDEDGFFAAYVPGNSHEILPDGFAKLLPAGASLRFQIHYTPNGTGTNDQTRIGLRFAQQPPRHQVHVTGIANGRIAIPPGASNHLEKAVLPVPVEARLLAFLPHMHVRGKAFAYELVTPDGHRRRLLDIPRYDFNWQLAYRLADPLPVPAGSRLEALAWYDNSAHNPANPDPNRLIRWGPQTDDEMLLGYVEYYLPAETPGAGTPAASGTSAKLGDRFAALDTDGNGILTREELPARWRPFFDAADIDHSGGLTREELGAALLRLGR